MRWKLTTTPTLAGRARSPWRGAGDSENAGRRRPRTSLGHGAVKAGGSRIEWAQILRRIIWWMFWRAGAVGGGAIVADVSDRNVVVAILAHLGLPTEAPPVARARSAAFELS